MFRLRAPPASLTALVVSGCLAFRPQLPANLERVRSIARAEWLGYGTCGVHQLRRCENGHQTLTASDGFQYWTTVYDGKGGLEFEVRGGCMGVLDQSGTSPDCPDEGSTLVKDLCVEALAGLESRGLELNIDCVRPSRAVVPAGETFVDLVDGARLRFLVPSAPLEPVEVFFDEAPPGVVLLSCAADDCVPLDAGAPLTSFRLSVSSPGKTKACELWFSRSFLIRADAGMSIAK